MPTPSTSNRLETCEEFLAELGRDIPETERVMVGYADEATVQTDSDGKKLNAGWWPQPYKADKYIPTGDNCYVCISSSIKTPNPKNGQMRYWRGEASFGHGLALMVDDIGDGVGAKGGLTVEGVSARLAPTVVVETSKGNHQLWYFFDAPVSDMRRFKALLVCFVAAVLADKGGDSTIRDVSRYGRMPYGINNKRKADGAFKYGDGKYQPRIISADYSKRYDMDEIAAAFGFVIEVPVTREKVAYNGGELKYDEMWLQMGIHILSKALAGEGTRGEVVKNMSGKYRIRCPWGEEHTNGDPYGAYIRGTIPGAEYEYVFGCAHDTCRKDRKRTWATFLDEVVLPEIIRRLEEANASTFYHPTKEN